MMVMAMAATVATTIPRMTFHALGELLVYNCAADSFIILLLFVVLSL
jgi:hypothetical protein